MLVRDQLAKLSEGDCRELLGDLLESYLTPAFGTLPKREIDLLFFKVLERAKYIDQEPSVYSLVQRLRVTQAKARSLLYDLELRRLRPEDLDKIVRELLKKPRLQKQGELFVLDVDSPLVADHLRHLLRELGYTSDGSFSPTLVKLSLDAVAALIEHFLTPEQQKEVQEAFAKAGAPDKSIKGFLLGVAKKLGGKVADETGSALAEQYLAPLIEVSSDALTRSAKSLFASKV